MKTIVSNTSKKEYLISLIFTSIIPSFILKIANSIKIFFLSYYIKRFFIVIFVFGGIIGLSVSSVFFLPSVENLALIFKSQGKNFTNSEDSDKLITNYISQSEKNIKKLKDKIGIKSPKASYLVVNTSENHFYLYKNKKIFRQGLCSTGSYIRLEGEGEQKWIFKTPRGEFKIRDKKVDPVWKKPDWAFIEEGLPVPSKNHESRFEYGTLGDYALILGDGYMIHGTLYQRFLGKPVTHGCVRLGDADLKQVFSTLNIGSKVYIF